MNEGLIFIMETIVSILLGLLAGLSSVFVFNHIPARWLCEYGEPPEERERIAGRPGSLTDPYVRRLKQNPWRWAFSAGFTCLCVRVMMQSQSSELLFLLTPAVLIACWSLMLIALSDRIYMIIPDQFLLVLAAAGLGLLPGHMNRISGGEAGRAATGGDAGSGEAGWVNNGGEAGWVNTDSEAGWVNNGGEAGWVNTDSEAHVAEFIRKLTGYSISDDMVAVIYLLAGIAIGISLMLLVGLIGRLVSGQEALGFGDVKLYAVLGFCLGAAGVVFVFLLSTLTAGVEAGVSMAAGKACKADAKPLGPHICAAAFLYLFVFWI